MLGDPLFGQSLLVTCLYVLGMVPGVFIASLGLALLVNARLPLRGLFRAAFFLPHVVSLRSEERRVGKEGRGRVAARPLKRTKKLQVKKNGEEKRKKIMDR